MAQFEDVIINVEVFIHTSNVSLYMETRGQKYQIINWSVFTFNDHSSKTAGNITH
jgi:hypothetical protein